MKKYKNRIPAFIPNQPFQSGYFSFESGKRNSEEERKNRENQRKLMLNNKNKKY